VSASEFYFLNFFFQAEDGIRDFHVTGVQTCALPICVVGVEISGIAVVAGAVGDRVEQVVARSHEVHGDSGMFGEVLPQPVAPGVVPRAALEIGRASCRERAGGCVAWDAVNTDETRQR